MIESLYAPTTGIVFTEERVSEGQHQLDLQNLDIERFVLPGGGESYETCGTVRYHVNCVDEQKWLYDALEHCDRPECPTCFLKWLKRASSRATEQVWQIKELARKEIYYRLHLSSVVLSTPQDLWDSDMTDLWHQFRRAIRRLGTVDVAAVLHLFRFRDSAGNEISYKSYIENPSKYHVVRQPHFHCIIMGRLVKSKDFHARTNWVYVKLGGHLSREDVYNIIHYALSHTAISLDRQRQLIHYYGLFKKARIGSINIEIKPVLCPDCKGPTERHYVIDKIVDGVPCPGFHESHYQTIIHRTWCLPKLNSKTRK
jgi:hypothetical protein